MPIAIAGHLVRELPCLCGKGQPIRHTPGRILMQTRSYMSGSAYPDGQSVLSLFSPHARHGREADGITSSNGGNSHVVDSGFLVCLRGLFGPVPDLFIQAG